MPRKRFGAEQIIPTLREAEVDLAKGQTVAQFCKKIGVTEQKCYRWRKEYGGLRTDQADRVDTDGGPVIVIDDAMAKELATELRKLVQT